MRFLWIYMIAINAGAFLVMKHDKSQARRSRQRVPEKTLFTLAAFGGALGIWAGMQMYRHKTRHLSFIIGVPVLFIWNVAVFYYLYTRLQQQ